MFPTKESILKKNKDNEQNELLEIFLLIEENTNTIKPHKKRCIEL